MTTLTLTKTRFVEGTWEGVLTGAPAAGGGWQPKLVVTHLDRPVPGLDVTEDRAAGQWLVRIAVPAGLIGEGVSTFLIRDTESGTVLDSFAILAGDALADDIRAEVDLLREELDMLKRAFRRHCIETMSPPAA